jgi:hypothetical protein
MVMLMPFIMIPALSAQNNISITPENYLNELTILSPNANEIDIKKYLPLMKSTENEIDNNIITLKNIQQSEITDYKNNPDHDDSLIKSPEIIKLKNLISDTDLKTSDTEFSQFLIKLFESYRTKSEDQRRDDVSFAAWVAESRSRSGAVDSPGNIFITVKIPDKSIFVLSKFNKELSPEYNKYIKAIRNHLARLRSAENEAKNVTHSKIIPILVRAAEINDYYRMKLVIKSINKAYERILFIRTR